MSAYVRRVVNGHDQWLGRNRFGDPQWTPDKPSRTRFESKRAAEKAVADLVRRVVGLPEVVTE